MSTTVTHSPATTPAPRMVAPSSRRLRPRGRLRHYAALLSPNAAAGGELMFERDAGERVRRMGAIAADRARERLRPSRGTMLALQVAPGGRMRWHGAPAPPPPGPEAAVVRPIAAATCDIDRSIALGASQFALPLHLGHECVAEVLSVGERVRSFAPGDRVIVPFQINCGRCEPCRGGRTGNCTGIPPLSMYGMGLIGGCWGGSFAEQLAVPFADAMLVALPDGVEPAAAASVADNICDAYRHVAPHLPQLLERDADTEVLILAVMSPRAPFTSSTAIYAGLIAKALGARNVTLADARPEVRIHAERLGLETLAPRDVRRRRPVPLVVDISATQLALALSSTAPDGICTSAGSFHRSTRVPTLRMYGRNVTLHIGRSHVRTLIPPVLELLAAGTLEPQLVTTNVAPMADAPRALYEHATGGGIKTILLA